MPKKHHKKSSISQANLIALALFLAIIIAAISTIPTPTPLQIAEVSVSETEIATDSATLDATDSATLASTSPSPSPSLSPSPSPSPSLSPSPSPSLAPADKVTLSSPTNLKYNCYAAGSQVTLRWDSVSGASSYSLELTSDIATAKNSTITTTRSETDLMLSPSTPYKLVIIASADGAISSQPSTLSNLSCASSSSTPTPTPSQTPKTTAPIKSPSPVPNKNPTPSPTPLSISSDQSPQRESLDSGSLADIFASPTPTPKTENTATTPLLKKIFLGWQALFYRFVESFAN